MAKKPREPTTEAVAIRCRECPDGLVPTGGPAAKLGVCCKCYRKNHRGHQQQRRRYLKGKARKGKWRGDLLFQTYILKRGLPSITTQPPPPFYTYLSLYLPLFLPPPLYFHELRNVLMIQFIKTKGVNFRGWWKRCRLNINKRCY